MKAVLVGIVAVAFAGGASLKEVNAAPMEIDVGNGKAV
jgi:hypothetical protein